MSRRHCRFNGLSIPRVYLFWSLIVSVFLLVFDTRQASATDNVASHPTDLISVGQFGVSGVIDGDTLVLADGREVRLTGIQAPKLPLGRPNFPVWPLAEGAKSALERLVSNQQVTLYVDGARQDRYQRVLAHPVTGAGTWLQGEMVRLGLARVYSFADNRRMAPALYDREREARLQRRGIWALEHYAVRTPQPESLLADAGTFQVVEGRIVDAAKVRSRLYLNFGADYKTDFTASVERRAWSMFEDGQLEPETWTGKRIRVRGWIKDFNGPLIEVTHPEQIEVLDDEASSAR